MVGLFGVTDHNKVEPVLETCAVCSCWATGRRVSAETNKWRAGVVRLVQTYLSLLQLVLSLPLIVFLSQRLMRC